MRKARYICFEGGEGVGKTTQTKKLADYLRARGYKVLETKEPGTPHSPLTMQLRGIMLDKQYDAEMTRQARELISQAIRSIHLEKVVQPSFREYDFIIQDRGQLSGFAYGTACGNNLETLEDLSDYIGVRPGIYDDVVYLKGDIEKGLKTALAAKQEFAAGDAMEAKGLNFLDEAAQNMERMADLYNTATIEVDGKSIDEVFEDILRVLHIQEN